MKLYEKNIIMNHKKYEIANKLSRIFFCRGLCPQTTAGKENGVATDNGLFFLLI